NVKTAASTAVLTPEAEVGPESGSLDQDVDTLLIHEVLIPAGGDVLAKGVGNIGIDVVLRCPGRVVGRCLFAVDRTPGEERAILGKLLCATAGRTQHVVTE